MADKRYRLETGVQQTLAAVLPSLPSLVNGWQEQVKDGEIDEQFRSIAVALGWITLRDSRVSSIAPRVATKLPKPTAEVDIFQPVKTVAGKP